MTAKRLFSAAFLIALLFSTGCRHFCEKHYPCNQQCCPAPCCPAPAVGGYPPPPAPVPAASWAAPAGRPMSCTCVPQ